MSAKKLQAERTGHSVEAAKSTRLGNGRLGAFGTVFLALGVVFLFFMYLKPVYHMWRAQGWREIPCTVVSSSVEGEMKNGGVYYWVEITYDYAIEERQHRGDRYDFMYGSSPVSLAGKQAVVAKNPPGTKAVCFVDPDDPTSSVFERRLSAELWFALLPLSFVLVGGGIVIAAVRMARKRTAGRVTAVRAGPTFAPIPADRT